MSVFEESMESKYNNMTEQGMVSLLTDIHTLRESRFQGMDTSFVSCLLLDFEKVYEETKLTKKQRLMLYLKYELELYQNEIAESMGITQQSVSRLHRRAIDRLLKTAREVNKS